MRLLFAYHADEPSSESEPLPYHGPTQRGARSMFLLQRSAPRQPLPSDLMAWELRNPPKGGPAAKATEAGLS
ncbi:Protein of unknown function [Gryllus bimaculatus]|nr:Protein of unknown function [Gryllus bimaculatus]